MTTDGAPGLIKAVDSMWPRSLRIRCWFHKMQYLMQKVPPQAWPAFKALVADPTGRPDLRGGTPPLTADIPHCLCHSGEYSAIQARRRFPKELQQGQGRLGKIAHQRPRPRKAEQMDPNQVMAHPAGRRVLHPLAFVIGKRRVRLFARLTDAGRESRIDAYTDGPHQQECQDACGLCARARGGEKLGGFEEAKPALRRGVACRVGSPFRGGQQGLSACIGRADATTRRLHPGRAGREGGGACPCARGDDLGRLGALAWSATLARAGGSPPRDLVQARGVSSWRQRRQRLRRSRFTGQGQAAAWLASGAVSLTVRAQLLVDRALCLGVAVLSGEQQAALGDPTRGRGPAVSAIAR